ncbi:MAG: glutathione peroxidase [Bryobacterales bacterium]|nr:glutathione peroxidase [Bryobacterales bacterium]
MKTTVLAGLAMACTSAFGASVHDFTLKTIDGQDLALSSFKGKAVLIVNTASQCGLTPQYSGLEALNKKYAAQGLVVLGVPANNFGGQEPGSNEEIKTFCQRTYKVSFPMASKVSVKGADQHPLFKHLTEATSAPDWNFTKYLVGKDGKVIKRFAPATTPDATEVASAIEAALK